MTIDTNKLSTLKPKLNSYIYAIQKERQANSSAGFLINNKLKER